jgi:hypothetical protein
VLDDRDTERQLAADAEVPIRHHDRGLVHSHVPRNDR